MQANSHADLKKVNKTRGFTFLGVKTYYNTTVPYTDKHSDQWNNREIRNRLLNHLIHYKMTRAGSFKIYGSRLVQYLVEEFILNSQYSQRIQLEGKTVLKLLEGNLSMILE